MPAWFLATLSWTVLFRPTTQQISVLAFPPQGCEGYRDYRRYIPHRQPINKYFMLSFPRICLKIETNALYAGTQHMPVFKLVKDFVWGAVLLLLFFFLIPSHWLQHRSDSMNQLKSWKMRPAKWTKNCGVIRQKRPHTATSLPCVSPLYCWNQWNKQKKKERN